MASEESTPAPAPEEAPAQPEAPAPPADVPAEAPPPAPAAPPTEEPKQQALPAAEAAPPVAEAAPPAEAPKPDEAPRPDEAPKPDEAPEAPKPEEPAAKQRDESKVTESAKDLRGKKSKASPSRQISGAVQEILRKSKLDQSKAVKRSTRDFRTWSRLGYMSMMSIKRGSFASFQDRQKVPKYMNSYKLNSEKPFNADKVKTILVQILTESIEEKMTYDQEVCPTTAKQISASIRQKIKEQDYDRYKLVCVVTIGEKKSHDILTAVRFLWDAERDRFATHFHENMYIFAVATVFGVYYE